MSYFFGKEYVTDFILERELQVLVEGITFGLEFQANKTEAKPILQGEITFRGLAFPIQVDKICYEATPGVITIVITLAETTQLFILISSNRKDFVDPLPARKGRLYAKFSEITSSPMGLGRGSLATYFADKFVEKVSKEENCEIYGFAIDQSRTGWSTQVLTRLGFTNGGGNFLYKSYKP